MALLPMQASTSPLPLSQPLGAAAAGTNSSSSPSSASIGANDFLQLLVTEMKNQDPTASRDPNEYINQLVQVNSLEQLIQINQDLKGASSSPSASSSNLSASASASSAATTARAARPGADALASAATRVASALGGVVHQGPNPSVHADAGAQSPSARATLNEHMQAVRNPSPNPAP